MAKSRQRFSQDDLRAIEDAVRHAEQVSGGELVVYLTRASDEYHLVPWKGAVLGSLAAALGTALAFAFYEPWPAWIEAWLVVPVVVGAALGYVAGRTLDPLRRSLIDQDLLEERVRRRAAEVFLSEEVFATDDRDGILLFVSVFERRVTLLADSGVQGLVPQEAWDRVTDALTTELRRGREVDGLIGAATACGELLARHRTDQRTERENELDDAPRIEGDE